MSISTSHGCFYIPTALIAQPASVASSLQPSHFRLSPHTPGMNSTRMHPIVSISEPKSVFRDNLQEIIIVGIIFGIVVLPLQVRSLLYLMQHPIPVEKLSGSRDQLPIVDFTDTVVRSLFELFQNLAEVVHQVGFAATNHYRLFSGTAAAIVNFIWPVTHDGGLENPCKLGEAVSCGIRVVESLYRSVGVRSEMTFNGLMSFQSAEVVRLLELRPCTQQESIRSGVHEIIECRERASRCFDNFNAFGGLLASCRAFAVGFSFQQFPRDGKRASIPVEMAATVWSRSCDCDNGFAAIDVLSSRD